MRDRAAQLAEIERLLQQAGIIDSCARRLVEELDDHYADLLAAATERGCEPQRAHRAALRALGSPAHIVAAAVSRPELLGFSRRHPTLAGLGRTVACFAVVPSLSVLYCAHRRESIIRWSASVGLAVVMTAALLLSMRTAVGIG